MKTVKIALTIILLLAICSGLLACGGTNIQTESAAIAHLQNYIKEKDEWSAIANELGLYYTVNNSEKFASSSYATLNGDTWTVVVHGSVTGYTDANQTQRGTFAFSYVAEVKTDGTVRKLFIQAGTVTGLYYE